MLGRKVGLLTFFLMVFVLVSGFTLVDTAEAISPSEVKVGEEVTNQKTPSGGTYKSIIKQAGWLGDKSYSYESGRHLSYDVYDTSSKTFAKQFIGGGSKFVFEGWASVLGLGHHTAKNTSVYVAFKNQNNGDVRVFKTNQVNRSITKDVDFAGIKTCASTASFKGNTFNSSSPCNFNYDGVGFNFALDTKALFGDGTKDSNVKKYQMFIIVELRHNNGKTYHRWTPLNLVGGNQSVGYGLGRLEVKTGNIDSNVKALSEYIVRRPTARGNGSFKDRYFSENIRFSVNARNDEIIPSSNSAVWFRVYDKGANAWSSSANFDFMGDTSTIEFKKQYEYCADGSKVALGKKCTYDITYKYVDIKTNKTLKTNTLEKSEGAKVRITPDETLKIGNTTYIEYETHPTNINSKQRFTVTNNKTIVFYYTTEISPPSNKVIEGEPNIDGAISWRLYKDKNNTASKLKITSSAYASGKHVGLRGINVSVSGANVKESGTTLNLTGLDPSKVKGGDLTYDLSYEYTNELKPQYTGVYAHGYLVGYTINGWVADWSKVKTHKETKKLKLDHEYGYNDVMAYETDKFYEKFVIGRTYNLTNNKEDIQYEEFSVKQTLKTTLQTQSYIPYVDNLLVYKSDIATSYLPKVIKPSSNYAYVPDLDDSLTYNNTKYDNSKGEFADLGKYKVELALGEENKVNNNQYTFGIETKDDFYVTRSTGFVFTVPKNASSKTINERAKIEYTNFTGATYLDKVLTDNLAVKTSYIMPVSGNSSMEVGKTYTNYVHFGQVGLTDATLNLYKQYVFQSYLLGSSFDMEELGGAVESLAWTVEQVDTVQAIPYEHTVEITDEELKEIAELESQRTQLLHGFKVSDGLAFYNKLKAVIDIE